MGPCNVTYECTQNHQVALTLPQAHWVVIMARDGSILEQGSRETLQVSAMHKEVKTTRNHTEQTLQRSLPLFV